MLVLSLWGKTRQVLDYKTTVAFQENVRDALLSAQLCNTSSLMPVPLILKQGALLPPLAEIVGLRSSWITRAHAHTQYLYMSLGRLSYLALKLQDTGISWCASTNVNNQLITNNGHQY